MSSTPEQRDSVDVKESSNNADGDRASDAAKKSAAKRRTKTGCLTCRKRRIKCDEGKPSCRNCIKSKRECAGYVQPLVYKQQTQSDAAAFHDPTEPFLSPQSQGAFFNLRFEQPYLGSYHPFDPSTPSPYQHPPFGAADLGSSSLRSNAPFSDGREVSDFHQWSDAQQHRAASYRGAPDPSGRSRHGGLDAYYHSGGLPASSSPLDPRWMTQSGHHLSARAEAHYPGPIPTFPAGYARFPLDQPSTYARQPQAFLHDSRDGNFDRQYHIHASPRHPHPSSSVPPPTNTAAFPTTWDDEYDDPDDPFDGEMDESQVSYQDAADNLTQILDQSGQQIWDQRMYNWQRMQAQAVASFQVPIAASPLQDERNERAFRHFVEITSHCISIFERHHLSPLVAPARTLWNFTMPALALSHPALAHGILALGGLHSAKMTGNAEDRASKHFMYAVRRVGRLLSLPRRRHEIATLATVLVLGFYEVLSGDHSRWNLHLSGATKLVLEHDIAGLTRNARRMRRRAKARVNQCTAQFAYGRVAGIPVSLLDDIDWEVDSALISRLIGVPVDYDRQVQPGLESQAYPYDLTEKDIDDFKTKLDLRWWYCKQDVFQSMLSGDRLLMPIEDWKYCPPRGQLGRADNPYATFDHLLLIMARLADFGGKDRIRKQRAVEAQGGEWRPPLWLFGPKGPPGPPGSKGKERSGTVNKSSSSGSGRNTASIRSAGQNSAKPAPAPSANEGRVRQTKPTPSQGPAPESTNSPPMFGMMPSAGDPQVHPAVRTMQANIKDPAFMVRPESKGASPPRDLDDETAKAFSEHADITKAFDVFRAALGPEFDPIPPSDSPIATPFGPALVYKNAAVACIWIFYNVGRILLHRLHPEMNPAAMISAGFAAPLTHEYAQTVGKICGGLYSGQHYGQVGSLEPSFAGALMESTFSLLFAAVQYTDPGQRGWTISKLRDVDKHCGWRTSAAIAGGCENAWVKMAQKGRGPPYERTLNMHDKDERVSGQKPRSSPSPGASGGRQEFNPEAEYESEFVHHDRSLIDRSGSTRVHWALGLLSVEEDIKRMTLDEG
ncbi:hypothetical protein ABEF95_013578 [Exophiala dermatitidis]